MEDNNDRNKNRKSNNKKDPNFSAPIDFSYRKLLGMLCKTNLSYDGQRSDDVCFSRRDLSQRECVGGMIVCAQVC